MSNGLNSHVAAPKLGLVRHVYVADREEPARVEAKSAYQAWFHNIDYLWAKHGLDRLGALRDFDSLEARDVVIAARPANRKRAGAAGH